MDPLNYILRKLRKKSKKVVENNKYTEFFLINSNRKVIEFLQDSKGSLLEVFFKKLLPKEIQKICSIKLCNESLEEINTWYYDDENFILTITVQLGARPIEISAEIDIENFMISVTTSDVLSVKNIDIQMLNTYLFSFLVYQAENIAKIYKTSSAESK